MIVIQRCVYGSPDTRKNMFSKLKTVDIRIWFI